MSLGNLAENIYSGNISLGTAKQKQREMENIFERFINYNSIKNTYKSKKVNTLLNAREFYKGRRELLIAFEENIFPLHKPYVFGKNEWKEKDIPGNEKYMPKTFKLSFLEKNNQTKLSKKENELLNRDFGYKNIDELLAAFNNTKTNEERDELFDKTKNKLNIFKKLNITVSDVTERKGTNNVIDSIRFVLDYFALDKNVNYSDSDSEQDSFDSELSDARGEGLKILTPNQMLSRLPIVFAQLKAGNLKNLK